MKLFFIILSGLFSINLYAANDGFTHVYSCTPANPAQYIVHIEEPENLDFVDGASIANALNTSGSNKILEIRNVLLTYFVIQTSDLETLKSVLKPYLSKTKIGIECDSPGELE